MFSSVRAISSNRQSVASEPFAARGLPVPKRSRISRPRFRQSSISTAAHCPYRISCGLTCPREWPHFSSGDLVALAVHLSRDELSLHPLHVTPKPWGLLKYDAAAWIDATVTESFGAGGFGDGRLRCFEWASGVPKAAGRDVLNRRGSIRPAISRESHCQADFGGRRLGGRLPGCGQRVQRQTTQSRQHR